MISDDDIKRDNALCDAATPGEWVFDGQLYVVASSDGSPVVDIRGHGAEKAGRRPAGSQIANAQFIARARTALPEYIAEVARLRAAINARATCERCKGTGTRERPRSHCQYCKLDHKSDRHTCLDCSGTGMQRWATDVLNGGEIK